MVTIDAGSRQVLLLGKFKRCTGILLNTKNRSSLNSVCLYILRLMRVRIDVRGRDRRRPMDRLVFRVVSLGTYSLPYLKLNLLEKRFTLDEHLPLVLIVTIAPPGC